MRLAIALVMATGGCNSPTAVDMGVPDLAMAAMPDLAMAALPDVGMALPDVAMMAPPDLATSEPRTVVVRVGANGMMAFSPSSVVLWQGDSIRWVFEAAGHNVVSGTANAPDGRFCTPNSMNCGVATPTMGATTTFEFKFNEAGVFPYMCFPHRNMGMVGLVTVQAVGDAGVPMPDLLPPPDLSGPKTHTVRVGQNGSTFEPKTLTIKVGDAVQWIFDAGSHNVVSGLPNSISGDGKFCSPGNMNCGPNTPIQAVGSRYDFTFAMVGNYPYVCWPHRNAGMTGVVIVQ